jgi:xanthine/uracil/vitamin C permease (AzgA family)
MRKLLGYICLVPVIMILIFLFLTPLLVAFSDHEWVPAIVFYGLMITSVLTVLGYYLIQEKEQ